MKRAHYGHEDTVETTEVGILMISCPWIPPDKWMFLQPETAEAFWSWGQDPGSPVSTA